MRGVGADLLSLGTSRRAVLATLRSGSAPTLVPICFVLDATGDHRVLHTPLDAKPKSVSDVHRLARVRDIGADPRVSVLIDEWSEDWRELRWARLAGTATVVEPDDLENAREHAEAIARLEAKYPQYLGHDLRRRPLLRIVIERVTSWSAS